MIGIVRDIVRAVLVLAVLAVGLELLQAHRQAAAPPPPPAFQPQWGPSVVYAPAPEPPRRIGRVGSAVVELAESVLGVFR